MDIYFNAAHGEKAELAFERDARLFGRLLPSFETIPLIMVSLRSQVYAK